MTLKESNDEWVKVKDAVKLFFEGGPGELYIHSTRTLYSFVKDKKERKVRVYRIMDFADIAHIEELREKYEWLSMFRNCPYGALSMSNQIKEQLFRNESTY